MPQWRKRAQVLRPFCLLWMPIAAGAGEVHNVHMLNVSTNGEERQVFEPAVIRIAPGDSVRFVAVDGGHNAASNPKMLPEGADEWRGRINEEIEITLSAPGVYGYHCTPHLASGMVGLILVGDVSVAELDAAASVRQRARARPRYEAYFEVARDMLENEG